MKGAFDVHCEKWSAEYDRVMIMIRWKGESRRWHLESVRILPGQMQAVSGEHRKESAVSAGLPVLEGLCP